MSVMVLPSSSFELSSASPFNMEGFSYWPPAGQYDLRLPAGNSEVMALVANVEEEEEEEEEEDQRPGQLDVWNAIQSQKVNSPPTPAAAAAPYVHPLMRRSSSTLSQKSLEICTESLGSETGSDDFSSFCDGLDYCYNPSSAVTEPVAEEQKLYYVHEAQQQQRVLFRDEAPTYRTVVAEDKPCAADQVQCRNKGRLLTSVNYHCSISRKSPLRSFPPPLPSISRRDGPCIRMKPHRRDGRLVVEAVPVPSQNYLHAQREGGRLLLSFIDATFDEPENTEKYSSAASQVSQAEEQVTADNEEESQEIVHVNGAETPLYLSGEGQEEDDELLEEEEEEEVEVVDRGTVVEVKVSSQTLQQRSAAKVVRSSLVINKFVGGRPINSAAASAVEECEQAPETNENKTVHAYNTAPPMTRRAVPTTTTTPAAAAVVAASTVSTISTDSYNEYYEAHVGASRVDGGLNESLDNKLLFTSKRRNREQLLHNMRRCSQLRRPLFIREPCCIATSS